MKYSERYISCSLHQNVFHLNNRLVVFHICKMLRRLIRLCVGSQDIIFLYHADAYWKIEGLEYNPEDHHKFTFQIRTHSCHHQLFKFSFLHESINHYKVKKSFYSSLKQWEAEMNQRSNLAFCSTEMINRLSDRTLIREDGSGALTGRMLTTQARLSLTVSIKSHGWWCHKLC